MGDLSKNFSKKEFKCRCCGYFVENKELLKKLQKLRNKIGLKITVNSGCRCILHNIAVGGSENSSHLRGQAADISCADMFVLLRAAMSVFDRVGISADYIHVDVDDSKPQGIYWVYMP